MCNATPNVFIMTSLIYNKLDCFHFFQLEKKKKVISLFLISLQFIESCSA